MNKMGHYKDCVSGVECSCFTGQSTPRLTFSKAIQTTLNPLSPHKYMIPYTYNMIPCMTYMMYVLLLLNIRAWGSDYLKCWGDGGESLGVWGAYTKCA
jgi:hypothetical protein